MRGEPSTAEVRRIALRQMALGLTEVRAALADECTEAAIHAVRLRLKKSRALLRLIAHAIGPDRSSSFEAALRELHHQLAYHRDHAVLQRTAMRVLERDDLKLSTADRCDFAYRLRGALGVTAQSPRGLTLAEAMAEVGHQFMRLRQTIRAGSAEAFEDRRALSVAVEDYAKARRRLCRLDRAEGDQRRKALHALRKAVKRVDCHRHLLHPIWPDAWALNEARLERLGECLGRHQDVCMLLEAFDQRAVRDRLAATGHMGDVRAAVDRRRRRLARRGVRLARKTLRPAAGRVRRCVATPDPHPDPHPHGAGV